MFIKCLVHSSICYVGTLRDTLHHVQANTKPLGISFYMHSYQVAIVIPRPVGCREVAMGESVANDVIRGPKLSLGNPMEPSALL